MDLSIEQHDRLGKLLTVTWKLSKLTLREWLIASGLPPSKRSAIHRLFSGQPIEANGAIIHLLDKAASLIGLSTKELTHYVQNGVWPRYGILHAIFTTNIWQPRQDNQAELLHCLWWLGRKSPSVLGFCRYIPQVLMTESVLSAYNATLCRMTPGYSPRDAAVMTAVGLWRQTAWMDADAPRHATFLLSYCGLEKMASLEFPFDVSRTEMNKCLETLRFVHLNRRGTDLRIVDDRRTQGCHNAVEPWDSVTCFDDRLCVLHPRNNPCLFWQSGSNDPCLIRHWSAALLSMAGGKGSRLLDRNATQTALESLLSRRSWVKRRTA